ARRLSFLEFEPGHFAEQPTGKGPVAVIFAGDGERSHDWSPVRPREIISHRNIKCTTFSREREREVCRAAERAPPAWGTMLYQAYQAHSDIMIPVRDWAGTACGRSVSRCRALP